MNNNTCTYKYITTAATTTFRGDNPKVVLVGIYINKPLTGTLTIQAGSTPATIGIIAATTIAGTYWDNPNGTEIDYLQIVNGSTEDVTVAYRNV